MVLAFLFIYSNYKSSNCRPNSFIKNKVKQVRYYSTNNNTSKYLNPWWVTGQQKALVIFGTNLKGRSPRPFGARGEKFSKKELAMVKLTPYTRDVIVGLLLSDGWLTFAASRSVSARLGFKQSLSNSEYVLFVFNILSHYCSS